MSKWEGGRGCVTSCASDKPPLLLRFGTEGARKFSKKTQLGRA